MAIPKYDEMYNAVLESLLDGQPHDKHDVKVYVKKAFNLTDEEMSENSEWENDSCWKSNWVVQDIPKKSWIS